MPTVTDFRLRRFTLSELNKCGKHVGRHTYWKLYTIENLFRVIINSVLSAQLNPGWWATAVDNTIREKAERFKKQYLGRSWHGKPGTHDIYYVYLSDLNEIMRANAHIFDPVLPELDKWILGIEELRLPRNVVAHMNFPSRIDIKRIDVFFSDCQSLITEVEAKVPLIIP